MLYLAFFETKNVKSNRVSVMKITIIFIVIILSMFQVPNRVEKMPVKKNVT